MSTRREKEVKKLDFKKLTKKERKACMHMLYELMHIRSKDLDNQLQDILDYAWDPGACEDLLKMIKHDFGIALDHADRFFRIKKALDTSDRYT